jgi:molecular chaperone DnaJ
MNGKGEPIENGTPGNLYVRVHVTPHKTLRKEGVHLVMQLSVKLTDAILGAKIDIDTLDDQKFTLKIPKGITHGEVLRVRGKGVPVPSRGTSGDLLIQVSVTTPTNLSGKAKKAIETLQEEGY